MECFLAVNLDNIAPRTNDHGLISMRPNSPRVKTLNSFRNIKNYSTGCMGEKIIGDLIFMQVDLSLIHIFSNPQIAVINMVSLNRKIQEAYITRISGWILYANTSRQRKQRD